MKNTDETDLIPVEAGVERKHGWRVYLVILVVGLYFTGYSLALPVGIQFLYFRVQQQDGLIGNQSKTFVCYPNTSDPEYQAQEKAQQESSQWSQYTSLASGIPSVVTALILGSYSDRIGRRWLFMAPTVGALARFVLFTAVSFWELPLVVLIPAAALDGLFGGFVTFFAASFAYASDITQSGSARTFAVVAVECVVGISFTLTSVAGGYLIEATGYTIPLLISVLILLSNVIIICFLPETRQYVATTNAGFRHYIWRTFRFYVSTKDGNPRHIYQLALAIFFLALTVIMGMGSVTSLYFMNFPFCWYSVQLGNFSAVSSAMQSVITIVMVKLLQTWLSDTLMGTIGAFLACVSFAVTGLASTDILAYIATGIRSFAPYIAMIRVILSKITAKEEQGAVYSSIAAIEAITTLTGGVLLTFVYKETLLYYRGIVLFIMSFMLFLTTLVYIVLHVRLKRHTQQHGLRSVTNQLPEPVVCDIDYSPVAIN